MTHANSGIYPRINAMFIDDKVSNLGLAPFFAFGTLYLRGILRIAI